MKLPWLCPFLFSWIVIGDDDLREFTAPVITLGQVVDAKLSHHGRNDKGHVYFTPDFINSLSPETIIITNTDDNCRLYGTRWNDFWKGCSVLATGSLHAIWEGVLCVPI